MRRALIVKLGAIGDVIMAVPAVHQLHLRGYTIDWVCGPAVAGLLRCYSWINAIPADDRAVLKGSALERASALWSLWRSLPTWQYDFCATLYYDRRWRVFSLPIVARQHIHLSNTERSCRILPGRHHPDEFHRILLGLPDECRLDGLSPLRPDRLPASPLAPSSGMRIALVPGGASNMVRQQTLRRWPAERYAAVADAFLTQGAQVLLLGGPDDLWVRTSFEKIAEHPLLLDRIGAFSLPEAVAAADTCELVLTHDTGPLHMAGLSSASILALFGPTDPGSFLPRRPGVRMMWGGEALPCRPCYDGRDFASCPDHGCMKSLATERVLHEMNAMLATRNPGWDQLQPLLPILAEGVSH